MHKAGTFGAHPLGCREAGTLSRERVSQPQDNQTDARSGCQQYHNMLPEAGVFCFGTYFATVAFVRLISRPLAGGYPTARRLSRRASGLEFDDVTPQWPADIAKWMVSDAIFPSALGGDVCIVLVRDCTPDQRRTTRELESGTHQIIRTPTSHEYTPNNPGIRK